MCKKKKQQQQQQQNNNIHTRKEVKEENREPKFSDIFLILKPFKKTELQLTDVITGKFSWFTLFWAWLVYWLIWISSILDPSADGFGNARVSSGKLCARVAKIWLFGSHSVCPLIQQKLFPSFISTSSRTFCAMLRYYTFCCSLRENTQSFVWNGDQ